MEIRWGQPYRRTIDLAKIYGFPTRGTYRAQLVYDAIRFKADGPGERAYSFTGQAFTVTIA